MPINYNIRADVVNICSDKPRKNEEFLVDTNVWYWATYSRASQLPKRRRASRYQVLNYPRYLQVVRCLKGRLYYCGLCLAELANVIEREERRRKGYEDRQTKEFRHNAPDDRARVVSEVEAAWMQVKKMGESANLNIDEEMQEAALQRLKDYALDGYDTFVFKSMAQLGLKQIITDDGDFSTVAGIAVFTANAQIIESARQQNRLVTR